MPFRTGQRDMVTQRKLFEDTGLYDLKTISGVLLLSVRYLRRLIRQGKLPAKKIGNKYYSTKKDISDFLEQQNAHHSPKSIESLLLENEILKMRVKELEEKIKELS